MHLDIIEIVWLCSRLFKNYLLIASSSLKIKEKKETGLSYFYILIPWFSHVDLDIRFEPIKFFESFLPFAFLLVTIVVRSSDNQALVSFNSRLFSFLRPIIWFPNRIPHEKRRNKVFLPKKRITSADGTGRAHLHSKSGIWLKTIVMS